MKIIAALFTFLFAINSWAADVGVTNVSGSTFSTAITNSVNGNAGGYSLITNVTFAVDTTAAGIAAGDALCPEIRIENAVRANGGTGILQEVTVNNGDDNNITFTLLVCSAPITWPATNSAANLVTSELSTNLILSLSSSYGTWSDIGTNRSWTYRNSRSPIIAATNTLFIYAINGAAITNTNSASITFKIFQD